MLSAKQLSGINEISDSDFRPVRESRVKLGRLLFYDNILSGNSNISCGTCHHHKHHGSDGVSLGVGEGGSGIGLKRTSGVMYAMGLGVKRDDMRAFEWYLRSAMKGHPGAQSGVGWYYEVGRGMPAPDLVRAYMWYVLSAIGGDPDAAMSQEEVVKKMSSEQIAKAHVLIDDYKVWLYPFR